MILAVDPGTSKIGWALVDNLGKAVDQGIAHIEDWDGLLSKLAGLVGKAGEIDTVVLGDATNRVNIEEAIRRLLPQAGVVVIDEKDSTVEAWKLKRREKAGSNPLRQLMFTLVQLELFGRAPPVDDYAARVLAQRYLSRPQR